MKINFLELLLLSHRCEFPQLVSYQRFVNLQKSALVPLLAFTLSQRDTATGIIFIDSTPNSVCKPKRMSRNKVFKGIAEIGKSTIGWFFGFKLHLIINDAGELLSFCLTPGNVDDREPVSQLCSKLKGKLFGDKGYISQKLFSELWNKGIQLITSHSKNMKNALLPIIDKILLRKRALIETVNDQLKNISQIEHSRHRSVNNFFVNLIAALAAYSLQPKKPHLQFTDSELKAMAPAVA